MRVVLAGASGFLGTHLIEHLRVHGHEITQLVRRQASAAGQSTWDPANGVVDQQLIDDADAVVCLSGVNIAGNPHSARHAKAVLDSRVQTTGTLARAIAESPTPAAFIAGNGISYYGDHGAAEITESTESVGDAFLTEVTHAWQEAAAPAVDAGARVAVLRTAPVLDKQSAPLKMLLPMFKLGLGARIGTGDQYFPIISLRDWVGAAAFITESTDLAGPFNLCSPQTPTNAEFTAALASCVSRPAWLFAPAPIVKLAAGRMAPEVLGSLNTRPAALERAGFDFADQDVHEVLATALA